MKVMTFNLHNNFSFASVSESFKLRLPVILSIINKYQPDIIGVQEMNGNMKSILVENLINYQPVGQGRYPKKHRLNEHNDLFISKELAILDYETFWLSSTPSKPGSRFKMSIFPRICTYGLIKFEQRDIRVYNTHFDHLFPWVRKWQLNQLITEIQRHDQTIPMLIMGDFNTTTDSKLIKDFHFNQDHLYSIYNSMVISHTHHNKKGAAYLSNSPIDYIYLSKNLKLLDFQIIYDKVDELYPSDHYPVLASIAFSNDTTFAEFDQIN